MNENDWVHIPIDIPGESDRRSLLAILSDYGLEVRTVKEKVGTRIQRFVEYRKPAAADKDGEGNG
jgi:hypothetical protein